MRVPIDGAPVLAARSQHGSKRTLYLVYNVQCAEVVLGPQRASAIAACLLAPEHRRALLISGRAESTPCCAG